jgi:hypothetical protein
MLLMYGTLHILHQLTVLLQDVRPANTANGNNQEVNLFEHSRKTIELSRSTAGMDSSYVGGLAASNVIQPREARYFVVHT